MSAFHDVSAYRLKERMTGSHPFQGRIPSRYCLSKTILPYSAQAPEAGLLALADGQSARGMRPIAINVCFLPLCLICIPDKGLACTKKSSITSGTSRRSFASTDLPTMADRFSSRFARPSSVDWVMGRNRLISMSRTMRSLIALFGLVVSVHVPQHLFQ